MKKITMLIPALVLCLTLYACADPDSGPETQAPATPSFFQETTIPPDTIASNEADATEASVNSDEISAEMIDGMRPMFKEAMDAYESFYKEYCEFMNNYNQNPADMTLLVKYSEFLMKAQEMTASFEAWDETEMNDAELKYYLEVNNRVMQMLVDVA